MVLVRPIPIHDVTHASVWHGLDQIRIVQQMPYQGSNGLVGSSVKVYQRVCHVIDSPTGAGNIIYMMVVLKLEASLLIILGFISLFSWMASKGCDPTRDRMLKLQCLHIAATSILTMTIVLMLLLVTAVWALI